jgi:muconate cycloisomerase
MAAAARRVPGKAEEVKPMKITDIRARLIDIPLHTRAKFAFGDSVVQNFAILQVQTDEGIEGLGEAACPGGPTWNEESVESIKSVIERYLAPVLLGQDPFSVELILERMDVAAKRNYFAKAAVEMALFDIMGKTLDQPVFNLLGGLYQERIALSWTLASGDAKAEIDEANPLWERGHRIFKFKTGVEHVSKDIARIEEWRTAFPDAQIRVDANQGWDEISTLRAMDGLRDLDIELLEQPVPRWNLNGMARLRRRLTVPLMADESVCTPADAVTLVHHEAADVFALKLAKAGGFRATQRVTGVAIGAGIPCYVGCMRETGIGTAAYAHFAAATRAVSLGCELFGPLMLVDDIVTEPIQYESGHIVVPRGPGLGVSLDEDKMRRYIRKG